MNNCTANSEFLGARAPYVKNYRSNQELLRNSHLIGTNGPGSGPEYFCSKDGLLSLGFGGQGEGLEKNHSSEGGTCGFQAERTLVRRDSTGKLISSENKVSNGKYIIRENFKNSGGVKRKGTLVIGEKR